MQQELIQKGQLLKFDPKTSFTILSKGHVVNVPFEEITHVTKHGEETVIHTRTTKLRTYHSLQEILNDLPVNEFFRVHKSQVVSIHFIDGYQAGELISNGQLIPMTAYYKVQLMKQLADILNQGYQLLIHEPTGRKTIPGLTAGYPALPEQGTRAAM